MHYDSVEKLASVYGAALEKQAMLSSAEHHLGNFARTVSGHGLAHAQKAEAEAIRAAKSSMGSRFAAERLAAASKAREEAHLAQRHARETTGAVVGGGILAGVGGHQLYKARKSYYARQQREQASVQPAALPQSPQPTVQS